MADEPTLYEGDVEVFGWVSEAHRLLADHGYPTADADGDFGADTVRAVTDFQTANGCTANGVIGNETWSVLQGLQAEAPGRRNEAYGNTQDAGDDSGDDDAAAGEDAVAMFVLFDNPGLLVNPDDEDNPDDHVILHVDAGTKVSFSVSNVGGAAGTCTVDIEVDNDWKQTWESQELAPGQSEATEVRGLGRYSADEHEFLAYVNPGAGHHDHLINRVIISD